MPCDSSGTISKDRNTRHCINNTIFNTRPFSISGPFSVLDYFHYPAIFSALSFSVPGRVLNDTEPRQKALAAQKVHLDSAGHFQARGTEGGGCPLRILKSSSIFIL